MIGKVEGKTNYANILGIRSNFPPSLFLLVGAIFSIPNVTIIFLKKGGSSSHWLRGTHRPPPAPPGPHVLEPRGHPSLAEGCCSRGWHRGRRARHRLLPDSHFYPRSRRPGPQSGLVQTSSPPSAAQGFPGLLGDVRWTRRVTAFVDLRMDQNHLLPNKR